MGCDPVPNGSRTPCCPCCTWPSMLTTPVSVGHDERGVRAAVRPLLSAPAWFHGRDGRATATSRSRWTRSAACLIPGTSPTRRPRASGSQPQPSVLLMPNQGEVPSPHPWRSADRPSPTGVRPPDPAAVCGSRRRRRVRVAMAWQWMARSSSREARARFCWSRLKRHLHDVAPPVEVPHESVDGGQEPGQNSAFSSAVKRSIGPLPPFSQSPLTLVESRWRPSRLP